MVATKGLELAKVTVPPEVAVAVSIRDPAVTNWGEETGVKLIV